MNATIIIRLRNAVERRKTGVFFSILKNVV